MVITRSIPASAPPTRTSCRFSDVRRCRYETSAEKGFFTIEFYVQALDTPFHQHQPATLRYFARVTQPASDQELGTAPARGRGTRYVEGSQALLKVSKTAIEAKVQGALFGNPAAARSRVVAGKIPEHFSSQKLRSLPRRSGRGQRSGLGPGYNGSQKLDRCSKALEELPVEGSVLLWAGMKVDHVVSRTQYTWNPSHVSSLR